MRIISFQINGQARWGALRNGYAIDLNLAHAMLLATRSHAPEYIADSALDLIRRGPAAWDAARQALAFIGDQVIDGVMYPLDKVQLLAPIPRPPKIVAIGLNYRDHAREQNLEPPNKPILFAKFPSSVIGPYETIHIIPDITSQVDYEVELGVVIGQAASRVTPDRALEYVFGYTVVNDVSARDIQLGPDVGRQWVRGKSFDTFCPTGPSIVTRDEIPDPQNLPLRTILNGKVMQDSNTREMIFSVAELVSFISQGITLEPGDLIATGTPHGVGVSRQPPVYLKAGDIIEVEVIGVGKLRNKVED